MTDTELASVDLLQRVTDQAGPSAESKSNSPDSAERWAGRSDGPPSLQRSTATAQNTGPAGETQVPDAVRDVISSRGRSLETSIQRAVEDRMGDSLGDVRIHTGPKAAQACDQINARAFTVGNHVAFNAGEYNPESPEGQHVLAHELAHVRQQTGGAVSMLPQEDLGLEIDPDPQLEREAEETAQQVLQGGELGIQRMSTTDVHVQRLGLGSLFGSSGSQSSDGEDNGGAELNFRGFNDGNLGETIATLIQNQQRIIEQIGGQIDEGGQMGVAEAGAQEALKVTAGATAAEAMPGSPGKAMDALPTNLTEAESLIADIAGGSADLIINAVKTMGDPQQLQSVAGDVIAQGGGETLQFMWTNAPKVAAAVVLAYAVRKTGGGLIKALNHKGSDIVSKVKSAFGSSEKNSRTEGQTGSGGSKF
ncbi:hypothetical protein NJ7G_2877 [Natrinema sp. J7-2]|nr:hypothetical protein NJ7G_2877 [Natrinema sp. J7-2]